MISKQTFERALARGCLDLCDLSNGEYCQGCGRTKEEIANWDSYSRVERLVILNRIWEK